jgi:hypothetical protein
MVLGPPPPLGADESSLLKNLEVLRERLTREGRPVPADEPDVQLEQRLPVSIVEFVQQTAPRRIGQGFEERLEIHPQNLRRSGPSRNPLVA